MSTSIDKLPLLLFSSSEDKNRPAHPRFAKAGRLRKIHSGIYTSDLTSPFERIVRPAWRQIVKYLYLIQIVDHLLAQLGIPNENLMNRD